ncbi:sulfurtransferase complex subunit TusC [Echinimonas agarilytica]|uniref:Sulfurtransferase complex subunit TusC n=1 Tax=Echinimonas agarilytica TaxID=1215918 RepID=A0AA42B8C2_9GAMM|nr:sulfurtransferase complex subunit TusC [Echinimonas agarilytica]MCM2680754.1 sulfurtransferase complex subunit TusC [Echinimonas agarilytica]
MVLIWSTQSPIGDVAARETLDAALAFAAYDQAVTLLLSDAGVMQLQSMPNAKQAGAKNMSKLMKALPMYDIDNVYACQTSLSRFSIDTQQCVTPVQTATTDDIHALILGATHVIRV